MSYHYVFKFSYYLYRYFIDYQNSDLNKFTYIDEVTGVVTVRNALDRELEPIVKVHVLAIDKGENCFGFYNFEFLPGGISWQLAPDILPSY